MRDVEKRRGDRLLCAGLVEVRWTETSSGECKAIANLDDLSPGGVSLLLDRPLPKGAFVEFTHSGQTVSGDVRHCNRTEIGWIVGVQFGPESQWDPEAYPPEHLLDPDSVPEDVQLRVGPHLSPETRSTIACLVLSQAVRREEDELS
jgi:hypothetical protein